MNQWFVGKPRIIISFQNRGLFPVETGEYLISYVTYVMRLLEPFDNSKTAFPTDLLRPRLPLIFIHNAIALFRFRWRADVVFVAEVRFCVLEINRDFLTRVEYIQRVENPFYFPPDLN